MDVNKILLEKFKQTLSPFAQKVLENLLHFKTENVRESVEIAPSNFETRLHPSNRKVLVFNDFSPSNTSPRQTSYNNKFSTADETFGSKVASESTSCVSTSKELLSPVGGGWGLTTRAQQLYHTQTTSAALQTLNDNTSEGGHIGWNRNASRDAQQHNTDTKTAATAHEILNCGRLEKNPSVDWNNFLDEDFFDDINNNVPKGVPDEKNKSASVNDSELDTTLKEQAHENEPSAEKLHEICESHIVPPNRKKPKTCKSSRIQRVKKQVKTKGFRKEKYTKVVKNWLNDVQNNVIEAAKAGGGNDAEQSKNKTNKMADTQIKNKVKKIVQARLANKGGKMKFAKPNVANKTAGQDQNITEPASTPHSQPDANEVCDKVTGKGQEKPPPEDRQETASKPKSEGSTSTKRDKKVRSKFVAPVLTPLPVRELTYEVRALQRPAEPADGLLATRGAEIAMALLYSNGFNQLNCQYAGSAAAPEGLMFGVADRYYYIQDFANFSGEEISQLLSSNTLISFHAKEVLVFLMGHYDLSACTYDIVDVKVGGSLLSPDEPPASFSELQKLLDCGAQFTIASLCRLQRGARYLSLLRDCGARLRAALHGAGMWSLFADIEMQALPFIAEMEHAGVRVDAARLRRLDGALAARLRAAERSCHAAAGRAFAVTSAPQVRRLLYDELRLHERCGVAVRETGARAQSTSEDMVCALLQLRRLAGAHALPALVLRYRRLHKARATFVAGVLQHERGGVVRPTWEQNAAVTGRVACSNPNLQAIPKDLDLALDTGSEDDEAGAGAEALSLRAAFVAREGCVLLAADFRHAECRVLALAAGDAALSAALASPDLFAELAAQWLDKPAAAVSAAERERTKRLVYAALYGAGARRLADILRLPEPRARHVMDSFHESFPALRRFGAAAVAAARGGRLSTGANRARRLPELASADAAARAHAERQAINFVVQGSAADLCKAAMAACGAALRRAGLRARPLLQIHDELLWELPAPQLPAAARVVRAAMEGCGARAGLPAVFPVQLRAGPTWGHLAAYDD